MIFAFVGCWIAYLVLGMLLSQVFVVSHMEVFCMFKPVKFGPGRIRATRLMSTHHFAAALRSDCDLQ